MGSVSGSRQCQLSLHIVRRPYRSSAENKGQNHVYNLDPGAGLGEYQYPYKTGSWLGMWRGWGTCGLGIWVEAIVKGFNTKGENKVVEGRTHPLKFRLQTKTPKHMNKCNAKRKSIKLTDGITFHSTWSQFIEQWDKAVLVLPKKSWKVSL